MRQSSTSAVDETTQLQRRGFSKCRIGELLVHHSSYVEARGYSSRQGPSKHSKIFFCRGLWKHAFIVGELSWAASTQSFFYPGMGPLPSHRLCLLQPVLDGVGGSHTGAFGALQGLWAPDWLDLLRARIGIRGDWENRAVPFCCFGFFFSVYKEGLKSIFIFQLFTLTNPFYIGHSSLLWARKELMKWWSQKTQVEASWGEKTPQAGSLKFWCFS